MNRPQTYKWSSFHVGWMRGELHATIPSPPPYPNTKLHKFPCIIFYVRSYTGAGRGGRGAHHRPAWNLWRGPKVSYVCYPSRQWMFGYVKGPFLLSKSYKGKGGRERNTMVCTSPKQVSLSNHTFSMKLKLPIYTMYTLNSVVSTSIISFTL